MRARILIAGLSAALGCAACGFKGPLYLPGQNTTVVTHPAPAGQVAPKRPSPAPAKPKRNSHRPESAQGSAGAG